MTWDDAEKKVAIHAIGQVECGMDYGATNPTDPISLGLFQWYGSRAADLLSAIASAHASLWATAPSTLQTDLTNHPGGSWWNNRYLTESERQSLAPVLRGSVDVQSTMAATDLQTYVNAGNAAGLDENNNSDTMAFFVNMYNVGPLYALQVLGNVGGNATLDQIYGACLNNGVLGANIYHNRWPTALAIIKAHDGSGVGDPTPGDPGGTNPPPAPPTGGNPPGGTQPTTDVRWVEKRGDALYVHHADGHVLPILPTGEHIWTPQADSSLGGGPPSSGGPTPPGGPVVPPTNPPGGPLSATQNALVAWMIAHINRYDYGQGPCRMTPDVCGYTDCSGLLRWCYIQVTGIVIGTYTGDMQDHGKLITSDPAQIPGLIQVGDCLIYGHGSVLGTGDHTNMYVGPHTDGDIMNHGGPGKGPVWRTLTDQLSYWGSFQLRRYL